MSAAEDPQGPGPLEPEVGDLAAEDAVPPVPALRARGLRLEHHRRTVFGPLDVDADAGDLLVVQGPSGSGKTSLLLALAGRMAVEASSLEVCGLPLPGAARAVRHRVALAELRGVNDLDDALTVEQHVAERLVLHQPWWKPWVAGARVAGVLDRVDAALAANASLVESARAARHVRRGREDADGADARGPHRLRRREFVSDLLPLERLVLGVVLALLGRPEVLVVDDVDALRDAEDRRRAWAALLALDGYDDDRGHHPLTVVVTCQDASAARGLPELSGGAPSRRVRVLSLQPADAGDDPDTTPGAP
ncbi:ATP-binding cassette domain-containing protein [Kineococcus rubinsiae]|uniref:ATP-binding cassette domain-containing protein n=1 Tax=Kineococcus rubinsiae TaxID=2609562 RepID=UPI001431EB80|nr:ATP-binding cassette domain-containing protein [Kineococcus rubinsiae]NIZ93154.1 hypothetical protein [Kineococcus rubinsiae]